MTLRFASGAAVLAVLSALGTYVSARSYLVDQRETSATRQTFADASFIREGLRSSGVPVSDLLGAVSAPAGAQVLVEHGGQRFSTSLEVGLDALPSSLTRTVRAGSAGVAWTVVAGRPAVVVGMAIPEVQADVYEIGSAQELTATLDTLRRILAGCAVLLAGGGAGLGSWTARRAMTPLREMARTAASIAGGDLQSRVPATDDPDLSTIVGAFNAMVDALEEQIQRQARFSADVSHELRSPLTTLVTAVGVLHRRRAELPPRAQQALALVNGELERFTRTLQDLLELGRLEAGAAERERSPLDLGDVADQVLRVTGRDSALLQRRAPALVLVDKQQISRAVTNLFDNADRHGGGLTAVGVQARGPVAELTVDDEGPGVRPEDRERIFERFARAGSRGALPGAGLGLSLVAETARAHGGAVRCSISPTGGARFTLRLPLAGGDDDDDREDR